MMRSQLKKLTIEDANKVVSIVLSVCFSYSVVYIYAFDFFPLLQLGIIDEISLVALTIAAAGCVVSAYVAKEILQNKILREMYFFSVLVPAFSTFGYTISLTVFNIDFPHESLVRVFWAIVGALLAYIFAENPRKALFDYLRKFGFKKVIILFTIFLLAAIPIISKPTIHSIPTWGYITHNQDVVFEPGNDTELNGTPSAAIVNSGVIRYQDIVFENGNDSVCSPVS